MLASSNSRVSAIRRLQDALLGEGCPESPQGSTAAVSPANVGSEPALGKHTRLTSGAPRPAMGKTIQV